MRMLEFFCDQLWLRILSSFLKKLWEFLCTWTKNSNNTSCYDVIYAQNVEFETVQSRHCDHLSKPHVCNRPQMQPSIYSGRLVVIVAKPVCWASISLSSLLKTTACDHVWSWGPFWHSVLYLHHHHYTSCTMTSPDRATLTSFEAQHCCNQIRYHCSTGWPVAVTPSFWFCFFVCFFVYITV